jgi:hypothetical protein
VASGSCGKSSIDRFVELVNIKSRRDSVMNEAAIREVFSDEKFVKGLFELETPETVQQALRQKDISLSVEEIVKIRELVLKRMETGAELSEEELESVTGGSATVLIATLIFVGIGMGVTSLVGIGLCTDSMTHGRW